MIAVNITTDTLTPHHRQVMNTLASTRSLMARLGKTAEVIIKSRFEDLNRRPNKRGFPKKNFWAQVKRSTALNSVTEREAKVAISDPHFALQLYGGTVRAESIGQGPKESGSRCPSSSSALSASSAFCSKSFTS